MVLPETIVSIGEVVERREVTGDEVKDLAEVLNGRGVGRFLQEVVLGEIRLGDIDTEVDLGVTDSLPIDEESDLHLFH